MKYLTITTAAALCLCATSNGIASSTTESSIKDFNKEHCLLSAKPEVGIDIGLTRAQMKKDSGDKMFNRKLIPFNVFFGVNISDNWGLEFGYGEAKKQHKNIRLAPGEVAPGADRVQAGQIPAHFQVYDTTISSSQPYASLRYKHPISEKLQLFAAVGVTPMKVEFSWLNTGDETGTPPLLTITSTLRSRTVNVRKTIPLAKVGFYYAINQSFSVRAIATWLQTSKLKTHIAEGAAGFVPMDLKQKDRVHYSIGLVYSI